MSETHDRDIEEIIDFVFSLAQESDRSAVILGAARLDVALENLLKKTMHYHPVGSDNLFGPDRPLGSFSSKITLAYRLGLIEPKIEHALHMLRRLRNEFAHSIETATLDQGSARSRVGEISKDTKVWSGWEPLRKIFSESTKSEALADFCTSISALIGALELQVEHVQVEVSHTIHLSREANVSARVPSLPED